MFREYEIIHWASLNNEQVIEQIVTKHAQKENKDKALKLII